MAKYFFLQFKENCDAVQLRTDTLCTFYRLASAEFDELEAMEKNKPWFNKWYEGRDESGQVRQSLQERLTSTIETLKKKVMQNEFIMGALRVIGFA